MLFDRFYYLLISALTHFWHLIAFVIVCFFFILFFLMNLSITSPTNLSMRKTYDSWVLHCKCKVEMYWIKLKGHVFWGLFFPFILFYFLSRNASEFDSSKEDTVFMKLLRLMSLFFHPVFILIVFIPTMKWVEFN